MIKPARKQILYTVAILIVGICAFGISPYGFQFRMNLAERYRDQSNDRKLINSTNSTLDAALNSNYQLLAPELAKFGLYLGKPTKSVCREGDLSLYKYACSASAHIDNDTMPKTLATPDNVVRVLANFDTFMRDNGFVLGVNDFRKVDSYNPSEWTATIFTYGSTVNYAKDPCDVSFSIFLSKPSYNTGGFDGLTCAASLLPGSYY